MEQRAIAYFQKVGLNAIAAAETGANSVSEQLVTPGPSTHKSTDDRKQRTVQALLVKVDQLAGLERQGSHVCRAGV
jgi:hypothetical protein